MIPFAGKRCPSCSIEKAAVDFHRNSRSRDGMAHYCKVCTATKQLESRVKDPEKARAREERYRAKPHPERQEKARQYMAVYNAANRERVNAAVREWNKRNRARKLESNRTRRVRVAGNGVFVISPKDQRRLATVERCGHCDCKFTASNVRHLDHRMPVCMGGTHSIGNLWALCSSCNLRKGGKLYAVWRYGTAVQLVAA